MYSTHKNARAIWSCPPASEARVGWSSGPRQMGLEPSHGILHHLLWHFVLDARVAHELELGCGGEGGGGVMHLKRARTACNPHTANLTSPTAHPYTNIGIFPFRL